MPRRRSSLPRKLPKQNRGQATVEALLTATAHILVREGFEGASTNRVAARAGVSIGSLYQYFPSKEALVAAVQERHVAQMLEAMERDLGRLLALPPPEAVREMFRALIAAHGVDPVLHRVLMEQCPRVASPARAGHLERRFQEVALAYLEAHRDLVRPSNLPLAAFVVVQVAESMAHAAVLHRPELLGSDAFVDEVTELLMRYLGEPGRLGSL